MIYHMPVTFFISSVRLFHILFHTFIFLVSFTCCCTHSSFSYHSHIVVPVVPGDVADTLIHILGLSFNILRNTTHGGALTWRCYVRKSSSQRSVCSLHSLASSPEFQRWITDQCHLCDHSETQVRRHATVVMTHCSDTHLLY